MTNQIRTRIAPSPTGNLHVGTARTALFNELFARQQGGKFIIRIEDTDRARSSKAYEESILEGLRWLGLIWDEGPDIGGEYGPYRQSERTKLHREALEKLLAAGQAYQIEGSQAIKLKVPLEDVAFTDLARGEVVVNPESWGGDFVIARSLDDPVFHLAVVVDDALQKITHVIRGEDHITNTARHILLQRALGYETPQYAHLPLLLDEQRRKLSKRAGETNLLAYRDKGYLPQAMLNYLALLGWHAKGDEEFFTHDQLIDSFSIDDVQKGGAIFSEQKLVAFNKHYLRQLSDQEILDLAAPILEAAGYALNDREYWQAAVHTERERIGTLSDLVDALSFFKNDWQADYPANLLVWRKSTATATGQIIERLIEHITTVPDNDFNEATLKDNLLAWIDKEQLGRGDVLWPMRVALTGREHSPGPFEVAGVLTKQQTLDRLRDALQKLSSTDTI